MVDAAKILEFLTSLGLDAQEVRSSLRAQGIKGIHGKGTQCPIARALTKNFDAPFCVTSHYVRDEDRAYICDLTPASRYFVGAFDYGEYPELLEGR